MTTTLLRAVRTGSILIALVGGTLILSQVVAGLVVVHVLSMVVQQMLG